MLPEKTWETESGLRLLLAIFATWSAGVLIAAGLLRFVFIVSDDTTKLMGLVIVTVAFHGAALFWVHHFLKAEKISWSKAFGFQAPQPKRALGFALLSAIGVLPMAWGLQQLSVWIMTSSNWKAETQQVVQEMQNDRASSTQQIYLAFIALIAAPIVEEILFRGILYPTLKNAGFPKIALWGGALLFALFHQNGAAFLSLFFFAIVLTLLYEKTGNLLAPMLCHSCFNLINFIFLLADKNPIGGP